MATTIVEQCQIAPSSGAPEELVLPLLYPDIAFFSYPVLENLLFYSFQCSESHFLDTIVGNLKNSLSLTLKHFPPLAGKIIFPLAGTRMPVSQYVAGDSISLTIAVSKADWVPLTGYHPRDADQFRDFIAEIPPATYSPEFIKFSAVALRVTLFPNQGICIGITIHHEIADATTLFHFVKTWASIYKSHVDDAHLLKSQLPFYDRSGVQDADALTRAFWERMKVKKPVVSMPSGNSSPNTDKTLATFSLSRDHIKVLNKLVLSKKLSAARLSSFAVACAYLWTCFARSAQDDDDDDDSPEYFFCFVNCRGRLNPPLPDNYFGNCLALVVAVVTHGRLKSDDGIVVAAEAIGEAIQRTLEGISDGRSLNQLVELESIRESGNRMIGIIGSPSFDVYDIDFGWGRVKKYEYVCISGGGSLSLTNSREFRGGVDVILSMPKAKVDAFAATFNQGLRESAQIISNQISKL